MPFGGGTGARRQPDQLPDGYHTLDCDACDAGTPVPDDVSGLSTRDLLAGDRDSGMRIVGQRVLSFFADLNEWAMANVDGVGGVGGVLGGGNFEIAGDQIRCVARINHVLSARQKLALFSAIVDLHFGECKGNFGERASIAITMSLDRFDQGFQSVTAVAGGVAAAAKSTAGT